MKATTERPRSELCSRARVVGQFMAVALGLAAVAIVCVFAIIRTGTPAFLPQHATCRAEANPDLPEGVEIIAYPPGQTITKPGVPVVCPR